LYFAQWINHNGLAFTFDVIGTLGQTTRIDLFNLHHKKFLFGQKNWCSTDGTKLGGFDMPFCETDHFVEKNYQSYFAD
jgi:hypothetical protein